MARLIDADEVDYENISCSQSQLHWLHRIIEMQPTVDAVEVVRCKDCQKCLIDNSKMELHLCMKRPSFPVRVKLDGFCSDGERKDGDGNG